MSYCGLSFAFRPWIAVFSIFLICCAVPTQVHTADVAQQSVKAISKPVALFSQGVRLMGDLWSPPGITAEEKRPAILMMHGFGGKRDELNLLYAQKFAAAGYYVMTFDYRGFGDSDGDLLPTKALPSQRGKSFKIEVREVRDVVNAINQYQDVEAALLFLKGEPGIDPDRIAAWGTSLGGGLALKLATRHPEIKVLIAQVPTVNMLPFYESLPGTSPIHVNNIQSFQIGIMRGEYPFVPGEEFWIEFSEHHKGFAHAAINFNHQPMEKLEALRAKTLIIDVEKEELFDVSKQGLLLYDRIKDKLKARHEVLPASSHFDVYYKEDVVSASLALQLDWLSQHLPVKPVSK